MKAFSELFSIFGMLSQVHSDWSKSFTCAEYKEFLHSHEISTYYTHHIIHKKMDRWKDYIGFCGKTSNWY